MMNLNKTNMKTFFTSRVLVLLAAVAVVSCVQDDDFDLPDFNVQEVTIDPNTLTDIDAAIDAFVQSGEDALTFEVDAADLFIEGYVVSSDESGNYFKELVIQDAPENPQRGVQINIDENALFNTYEFGRKIFVKLNGLAITLNNGVYQIGIPAGNSVDRIPSPQKEDFIIRDAEVATIVPNILEIGDIDVDNLLTYVRIEDLQFNRADTGVSSGGDPITFAGEPNDQFDGERTAESCADGLNIIISTSTFSDYASIRLPQGRGAIDGVLSRDFFDDFYILVPNDVSNLDLSDPNRCDPSFLDCNGSNLGGSVVLLDQDFESITDESQLDGLGYTNVNVSGGTERYEDGSFSGNRYLQVNAFGQNDNPMIAWLVTPELDFDTTSNEALTFDIQANFDNGGRLEVFVANDFTGDPLTATWTQVEAVIPAGNPGGFASGFTNVGTIDVSCVDGTVHFGFRYEGNDNTGATTRYHIDNIEVSGD